VITLEKMRMAGECLDNCSWTDQELSNCLQGTEYAIAFLEGCGENLIVRPLRLAANQLRDFQRERRKEAHG